MLGETGITRNLDETCTEMNTPCLEESFGKKGLKTLQRRRWNSQRIL